MGTDDTVAKLIQVHQEYQRNGGFDDADNDPADTNPLGDLKGFESDFIQESSAG